MPLRLICMSRAVPSPEPLERGSVPVPVPEQLPDDPATLKQMIVELVATLRQRDHDLEAARHRLHLLLQRLYGPRTERFDPAQLLFFAAGAAPAAAESAVEQAAGTATEVPASASSAGKRRARPHGRRRLPENLPAGRCTTNSAPPCGRTSTASSRTSSAGRSCKC